MSKSDPKYLDDMEYIKKDITEEQTEMEFPGCIKCGEEFDKNDWHSDIGTCETCLNREEKARSDLGLTASIISKVIYGKIGKADLKILQRIIFHTAKQDPSAVFEINQTKFAKEHGLQQGNVSKTLKKLLAENLLIQNEETGLYSLNLKECY